MSLALVVCLPLLAPSQRDGSLEDYLRRVRAERDAKHASLVEPVNALVARLEDLEHSSTSASRAKLADIQREIDALGPETARILLPYIDPGVPATDGAKFRAREVTKALVRFAPPGIVDGLIRRTKMGSDPGRVNAVRVLGSVPEVARASAYLEELFRTDEGTLRLEAVRSLTKLGVERNEAILHAALTDADPEVVRTVLLSVAESESENAAPAVLGLARVREAAAPVTLDIVAYYLACPQTVDDDTLDALVQLALTDKVELDSRIGVLDALPFFDVSKSSRLKRQLAPVVDSSTTTLREAGLICLTLLGDRSAKRELLKTYDQLVESDDDWPQAYERRGDVLLRIGEYTGAIRDYKRAIELLSSRARQGPYRRIWINLSRAYIKANKLRPAHDTLRDLGLTAALREELKKDPDFAPLTEHSRYKKLFE